MALLWELLWRYQVESRCSAIKFALPTFGSNIVKVTVGDLDQVVLHCMYIKVSFLFMPFLCFPGSPTLFGIPLLSR